MNNKIARGKNLVCFYAHTCLGCTSNAKFQMSSMVGAGLQQMIGKILTPHKLGVHLK